VRDSSASAGVPISGIHEGVKPSFPPGMTCVLREGAVWTHADAPLPVLLYLHEALMVEAPAARYSPAYRYGHWDGKVKFFRRPGNTFLAGLTARVIRLLREAGVEVTHSKPSRTVGLTPLCPRLTLELRAHQHEAVQIALHDQRATIQVPTGGGKTAIGAEICRRLGVSSVLWLVHSTDLFHQTVKELRSLLPDVEIGELRPGTDTCGTITVAMVQSLARRHPDEMKQWGALIVDEAHHASATTWAELASQMENAAFRIGLSGTAETGQIDRDMRREGALGPVHVIRTTAQLQDEGILPDAEIVMLHVPPETYPSKADTRDAVCPGWRNDPKRLIPLGTKLYAHAIKHGIIDNAARHRAFATAIRWHLQQRQKVLALVNRVDHGNAFIRTFGDIEIPCFWLHRDVAPLARKRAITIFREMSGPILVVASPVMREGINVPEIDVLCWMGGGEAPIMLLQAIGRGLREKAGRPVIRIYDANDGRDSGERKDYLAQQTLGRIAIFRKLGFPLRFQNRPN
jgi:superfamily II DNA or RNA helicase